ncbi:MAG: 50S ribosomal protein L5, partial [Polyangiales bacterium]
MATKEDKKGGEKAEKADKPKGDKPVGGGEKKEKRQKAAAASPAAGLPEKPAGYKSKASAPQTPRLKVRYAKEIAPALRKQFNYSNVMEVPRLQKIVINMGLGEAVQN